MIVVIIAGGAGTRLWPLSTSNYPKQLLKVLDDESLLQGTYRRARQMTDQIYIVPAQNMVDGLRQQLPQVDDQHLIIEPARRGTASCFVAALAHIQSRHDHDEPIAFLHADHAVRDTEGFMASFRQAGEASGDHGKVTLIGIEPTYPATGFGYIQKNGNTTDNEALVYEVLGFKEKPDFATAQQYLQTGHYLWNCGYFVGSINTFVRIFQEDAPLLREYYDRLVAATDPESFKETYLSFDSDTIDYALLEKTKQLLVVPASFDWIDVGSFQDLHRINELDERGNHVAGQGIELEGVDNCYIRNEESKPVAVIGLDNVVVVNTPHGVLVTRKDLSQKVGEIAKRVQAKEEAS